VKVEIRSLEFYAVIGLLEHERKAPQKLLVDAVFEYEYEEGRFLDYALAAKLIKEHLKKERFQLIEDALLSLERVLKERFPFITFLSLTIQKPHILPDCTPSVTYTKKF